MDLLSVVLGCHCNTEIIRLSYLFATEPEAAFFFCAHFESFKYGLECFFSFWFVRVEKVVNIRSQHANDLIVLVSQRKQCRHNVVEFQSILNHDFFQLQPETSACILCAVDRYSCGYHCALLESFCGNASFGNPVEDYAIHLFPLEIGARDVRTPDLDSGTRSP